MSLLLGTNRVPDVVALVGVLVFFAGLHLLWLSREDVFFWVREFMNFFAAGLRSESRPAPIVLVDPARRRRGALRIALGFLLAFFLAPMLITLGLGF